MNLAARSLLYDPLRRRGSSGKGQEIDHDVSIDDELTVFDWERVQLNERCEVTGLAASIREDGLELRTSKLPEGYSSL
jgi:hypothetical protein